MACCASEATHSATIKPERLTTKASSPATVSAIAARWASPGRSRFARSMSVIRASDLTSGSVLPLNSTAPMT